jgi:hypothetical protein
MEQPGGQPRRRPEADRPDEVLPVVRPLRPVATHHAGQWGLAALLLAAFLLLLFPVMLLAEFLGAVVGVLSQAVDEHALRGYATLMSAAVYGLIGLAALAVVFGLVGLVSALVRQQPAGLSVAGSVLAVAALVLQVVLLVVTYRVVDDTLKEKRLVRDRLRNLPVQPFPIRP